MTSLITQYLGYGLAADRPATPTVPAGALAIYTSYDTGDVEYYDTDTAGWLPWPTGAFLPLAGGTLSGDLVVPDEAYDATAWNGSLEVPTKNAVRDKIEAMGGGYTDEQAQDAVGAMVDGTLTYDDATPLLSVTQETKAADIASASTVNIGAAAGGFMHVTGTTTITAFDSVAAGIERTLRFAGILTLTHNATSLILPGAANITTAAGDTAIFRSEGSGNWRCISYNKASGAAVVGSASSFRGALVKKSADQTAADYTTGTAIAWNAETYDTDAIHDTAVNNTRLTVPSGVAYVRLSGAVRIDSITADIFVSVTITKNGSASFDGAGHQVVEAGVSGLSTQANTAVIPVSPGDYFEFLLLVESDTSITITAARSWFAMEIIG